MAENKQKSTSENFVSSVFKFSISTYVNFFVYGLSLLLVNYLLPNKETFASIDMFISMLSLVMTVGILGLDQSLIRFFNEPPSGISGKGLFRVCLYLSGGILLLAGVICSVFFRGQISNLLGLQALGGSAVPLLFLGAFFYMISRYFNVLYRMEQDIKLYTVQSIMMNFFLKMFYLLGAFFKNQAFAMMICSVAGLGAFALVFSFWRRDTLRLRKREMCKGVVKTVLPYGIPLAPTAIMLHLNSVISRGLVGGMVGKAEQGVYGYGVMLSNIVTTVQGGFASFWGAYMFENYKTQQERIKKVHDFLNFVILVFFALLVAFEDVLFLVLQKYSEAKLVFPLMMLSAVFTILCETTVYGIAIARKPIFDTIGIGLSFGCNILFGVLLMPRFGIVGAAAALAAANFVMYLFRTILGQKFYKTIRSPLKTTLALAIGVGIAVCGTVFAQAFLLKLVCCVLAILVYCLMYRAELLRCWQIALSILKSLFHRGKA